MYGLDMPGLIDTSGAFTNGKLVNYGYRPHTPWHFHRNGTCETVPCTHHAVDSDDDLQLDKSHIVNKSLEVKDMDMKVWDKLLNKYSVFLNTISLEVPALVEMSQQPRDEYWKWLRYDISHAHHLRVEYRDSVEQGGPWVVAGELLDMQTIAVLCIIDGLAIKYRSVIEDYEADYFEHLNFVKF